MARNENPGALAGATGVGKPIQAIADGSQTLTTNRVQRQHQETASTYLGLIAQLNEQWRVVVCKDGIQWILQRRDAQRAGRVRWTGASYHCERKSLLRVSRALCGRIAPAAMAVLEALPEWIGGAA
jgi:hypothetical protein